MIRLNMMGGLGNQMFQYAYARALSEKFHDKVIELNPHFSRYCNIWVKKRFQMTPNELKYFTLNKNVKEASFVRGGHYGLKCCVDYTLHASSLTKKGVSQEEFERKSKKGIYQMFAYPYYECAETTREIKYVTGYFTHEKYFENIRPILLGEFTVKTEASEANKKMMEEISACNAVCVHIRRGDYTQPKYAEFLICNEQYYQRAMAYIAERVENPVFYIFSNNNEEIAWIKNHYHFKQNVRYVELNNPAHEELRLMYHCKHFVISNSTFSWWGSYLARNEDKITAAPELWIRETFKEQPDGVYRKDMVKISVK